MTSRTSLSPSPSPPIRACLFDMDGLLINSEEIYTAVVNQVLAEHGKGPLPWAIKAELQGLPGPFAAKRLIEWSNLPYTPDELFAKTSGLQKQLWSNTRPMPGAHELLKYLVSKNVPIALASSSHTHNYNLKTAHLQDMFSLFTKHKVLGDDPRIPLGRGKPAPDIWLVALDSLNADIENEQDHIKPEECLVFEDGIPGVVGAKAAGSQVIWIPDPRILNEFEHKKHEIIGEYGEILSSLEDLDFVKYSL
ncbi:HAD-like domain-containing protein [Lipomyces japonicus]|uniref:HAD-like domain-containing protein n=1 Tax=Lipomyces japonicus TaxID=56871 RepID=UPI0034CF294D